MSSSTQNNSITAHEGQQLTRRQVLQGLAALPLLTRPTSEISEQPAPIVAGDPNTDKAAYLSQVLIPFLEKFLAERRAELAALIGGAA